MNKVKIWLMALLGIVATMGFAKEEDPASLKYERTLVITAKAGSGGVKATAAFAK